MVIRKGKGRCFQEENTMEKVFTDKNKTRLRKIQVTDEKSERGS